MWLIFQKSDKKIVGSSADTEIDLPREVALQEVVNGLAEGSKDVDDYDAFQVKDRKKVPQIFEALGRGLARLESTKGGGLDLVQDEPEVAFLAITLAGATEFHPVDKVPLIAGNGQSFVTISLQKVDGRGKPLTRKTIDKDVLWLRTDNGSLREDNDTSSQKEIRSIALASGAASFRLYSETAKRLATVQVFGTDPNLNGTVRVEFT